MNNPEAFKEDEVLSIKFVVPGLPFGKQRPKVTVRKFTGSDGKEKKFAKAYTPEKTVNYENLVKMAYQEKAKGKRSLQRRKRKTSMTKEELASAFGLGTSKFQCTADQLTENEVEKRRKVKMKKFSDMIQKSGNQEKPKARESPLKKRMFKITKRDDEQMLAFGWANVSIRSDGELIEDWQEDIVEPEDLEQAAYEFVQLYREGGEMHERGGVATLVESVVFTEEKQRAMGIPEGTLPVGWWIGFKVLDAGVWEKVKDGTYSMFSIEGEAERVEDEDID